QNSVAGDYYDAFFPLGNPNGSEKLFLVIADVAGKSIPAALLMATFQASLRTIAGEGVSLAELVTRLKRYATAHSLDRARLTSATQTWAPSSNHCKAKPRSDPCNFSCSKSTPSSAPPTNSTTSPASFSAASNLPTAQTKISRIPPAPVHNRLVTPRALANSICDQLIRSGFQALLAGGCVRDLLLGREPADYDVATDASPDQVMAL